MKICVTMLGTSSMVPTRERNSPAVLLEYSGELILVDCGEGTQRQMNIAGKSRSRVTKILLTHWHGDHVGGLGPLLQTMFNAQTAHDVELYGPAGTEHRFDCITCAMEIATERVHVHELEPPDGEVEAVCETKDYVIECAGMRHGVPTVGYAFTEKPRRHIDTVRAAALGIKPGPQMGRLQAGESVTIDGRTVEADEVTYWKPGKKVALVTDTLETPAAVALARNADLLIAESTYANEHRELAAAYNHMTASQTAAIAKEAGVARLLLTHFSQRYEDVGALVEEARAVLPSVEAAHDFMRVEI